MTKRGLVVIVVCALVVGASAAHVAADIGAWANVGTTGNCENGISASGDGTTLLGASTAAGWSVIAQSNTNCTTANATYGNSQSTNCSPSFTQHRCISVH